MDSVYGWVWEEDDTVLATVNGGRCWQRANSVTGGDRTSVRFAERERGWASGTGGTILSTVDGGRSWQPATSDTFSGLYSIHFTDREYGWVSRADGTILSTTDGGQNWKLATKSTDFSPYSIHFTDRERGWASGAGGTILSTVDGGRTWQHETSGTDADLLSIHFTGRERGWVSGIDGTILSTVDGGRSWKRETSGTDATLSSIHFTDREHGWTCGTSGTILSTVDGGRSWKLPAYRRLPASWYWVLSLALILVCLFVLQRRGRPEQSGETVADLLASDRPLEAGDPDPLDLHRISSGLARFIANRNTDPPLTIAVTGEWGTGKSSLMNLLYHDLKLRRFQPVWFNAWHHQKGEQLLASLYAHIRQQAVPPLWHPTGIIFRLRLLFRRGRRNRLAFGALAFLLFATYPFLESVILSITGGMTALVKALIAKDMNSVREILSFARLTSAIPDNWMGALIASPAVAVALRAIRAFGLSPQRLLTFGTAEGGKQRGLDPGARSRFAREFEDVAASLDLGAMVIFIDDLDRCSKENVVEILETINFLAVSGRCFIILGMARQWVETCVALQFKELAEETGNGKNIRDDGYANRRRFAKQYLEKLINIEVPVPVPSPDEAKALLVPEAPEPVSPMVRMIAAAGKAARKYAPVICLAVLALLAWYLKDTFIAKPQQVYETPRKELLVLPAPSQKGELVLQDGNIRIPLNEMARQPGEAEGRSLEIVLKGQEHALETGIVIGTLGTDDRSAELVLRYKQKPVEKTPEPSSAGQKEKPLQMPYEKQRGEATFRPGAEDTSKTGYWLALLAGLGLGVIGVIYLVQRPLRFTSDSKTFRDALTIWYPWIVLVRRTPRTIKRFLNRLRYVAMRLRIEPDRLSLWERMKKQFFGEELQPAPDKPSEGVPEPVLVALGAIWHVDPGWVKDTDTLRELFSTDAENLVNKLENAFPESVEQSEKIIDTAVGLANAILKYKEEFGQDVDVLIEYREAFLDVLAETGM